MSGNRVVVASSLRAWVGHRMNPSHCLTFALQTFVNGVQGLPRTRADDGSPTQLARRARRAA
jgi:hypothetical protein